MGPEMSAGVRSFGRLTERCEIMFHIGPTSHCCVYISLVGHTVGDHDISHHQFAVKWTAPAVSL